MQDKAMHDRQPGGDVPGHVGGATSSPSHSVSSSTKAPSEATTDSDVQPEPAPHEPAAFARYRILQKLGEGGMGVVYRAYDETRARVVALKTLQQMSPAGLYRFKQEFRTLADLAHPNLVPLYELVSEGNQWCFTMELVEGTHLMRYVAGTSTAFRLDDERLNRIREQFAQLVDGINALHAADKLHRDIKPSNVLVTSDGRLVLLDFGLAAELNHRGIYETTDTRVIGTVAYMSPEQSAGEPLSRASDWYSVGVMLYQALTERLPFAGSADDILRAKLVRLPAPPAEIVPGVPDDLNALCVDLLRRTPGARPLGQTLASRFRTSAVRAPATAQCQPAEPSFVGRRRELAVLHDAFGTIRQGRPVIVYVRGESGVGKSALVHRFLDEIAADPNVVILTGRCYEQESVPFKALDSLVDSISRYLTQLSPADVQAVLPRDVHALARVFPVLRRTSAVVAAPAPGSVPAEPHELRRRASTALRELLARIGDRRPLVLAIDDLQWGDMDSASLLGDILLPPDPPVFLAIGCSRTDDGAENSFFRSLRRSRGQTPIAHEERTIVVEPLDAHDTRDLTLKLLRSSGPAHEVMADAIVRESAGRPLFVYELVAHASSSTGTDTAAIPSALSLDEALWRRIERLSDESRRLLEVVAVAGHPIQTLDACRAAGLTTDDRSIMPTMRAARLLRGTGAGPGESIEAYHDRVRECVMAHLDADTLGRHHRSLADTLLTAPQVDSERLGIHLEAAGAPEEAAAHFAHAALAAADALAFDHAALLYRRALALQEWGEEESAVRSRLGDALANAGRGAEAAKEYLAAARNVAAPQSLELQRRAALQLLTSGHVDEGLRCLDPVLRAVGTRLAGTPRRALASMLVRRVQLRLRGLRFVERSESAIPPEQLQAIDIVWSVVIGLSAIDPIRGADFQTRSLLLALKAGEPLRVTRALALEAAHLASTGAGARAVRVLEDAERIASRLDHPYGLGIAELAQAAVAYFEQRWPDALRASRQAVSRFRQYCTGVTWEIDTGTAFSLWSLTNMGQIAELNRICPGLLREARERSDRYAETNLSTQIMALVRLAADDADRARVDLDRVMREWSQQGYHVQHHDALIALIPLELYCGDAAAAWDRLGKEWSAFRWSFLSRIPIFRTEMLQLRAYSAVAMASGSKNPDRFLGVAERDARRLRGEKGRWNIAFADYVDGMVAAIRGDVRSASTWLEAAVGRFDGLQAQLHAAATRRRLAAVVNCESSDELGRTADEWFAAQGVQNPARMAAAFAPGPN